MARITAADCIEKVKNKFELVALAAQRARDICSGAQITVDPNNDKNPVIALREIALGNVKVDVLKEALISGLQTRNKVDHITKEENFYAERQESDNDNVDFGDTDIFASDSYTEIGSDPSFGDGDAD